MTRPRRLKSGLPAIKLIAVSLLWAACGSQKSNEGACRAALEPVDSRFIKSAYVDYRGRFSCLAISSRVDEINQHAPSSDSDAGYEVGPGGLIKNAYYIASEVFIAHPASERVSGLTVTVGDFKFELTPDGSRAGTRYRGYVLASRREGGTLGGTATARLHIFDKESSDTLRAVDSPLVKSHLVDFYILKVRADDRREPVPPILR